MLKIFFIFLLFPLSAFAKESCYSSQEAEAEQGIRIHSELMVIGLNCQHMGKRHDMDLYGQYRKITADHADLFEEYEGTLMTFFEKEGDKKPESRLRSMRTGFANKISQDAAKMRPDVFCGTYAPRLKKAHEMTRPALRQWAATIFPSHPVSHPLCKG